MNVAVVGAQWGDEGKGKVVDIYGAQADLVVRYQGGNNAGHTVVVGGKKTILHIIPSGVLHAGKICLIANGVVFDPKIFFEEIDALLESGTLKGEPHRLIQVSERAHVILEYHRQLDCLRETRAGKDKIGTTSRGIGPAYEDKAARRGIQVIDLLHPKLLREKLNRAIEEKNVLFQSFFKEKPLEVEQFYEQCLKYGERLKPYISDVRVKLQDAIINKQTILFEGAQGAMLDVDHGSYPYVTSSSVVAGGILTGCGLGPGSINQVIGISKAYTTRVGTGPFPTEMKDDEDEIGTKIRDVGAEYGATTGRPRRTGWLDLVALKYAVEVNGLTGIGLMKADVMNDFNQVKVCTRYTLDGQTVTTMPSCVEDYERVKPVYQTLPGWQSFDVTKTQTRGSLPKEMQDYIKFIEDFTEIPIVLLSAGPGREATLQFKNPFVSR